MLVAVEKLQADTAASGERKPRNIQGWPCGFKQHQIASPFLKGTSKLTLSTTKPNRGW